MSDEQLRNISAAASESIRRVNCVAIVRARKPLHQVFRNQTMSFRAQRASRHRDLVKHRFINIDTTMRHFRSIAADHRVADDLSHSRPEFGVWSA